MMNLQDETRLFWGRRPGAGDRRAVLAPLGILLLCLLSVSCAAKKEEAVIVPPPTDPLSRDIIGYGVVNVSYIHVLEKPPLSSSSLSPSPAGAAAQGPEASAGYLRRGTIVRVLQRRSFRNQADNAKLIPWVYVEGNAAGWLPESAVDIYDNESRALTASKTLGS